MHNCVHVLILIGDIPAWLLFSKYMTISGVTAKELFRAINVFGSYDTLIEKENLLGLQINVCTDMVLTNLKYRLV